MLKIIRTILQKLIDDIDADNTNISYELQCLILRALSNVNEHNEELSKTKAAEYMNMSVSTFEKRMEQGLMPKGVSVEGFKEHRWYKSDLDVYKMNKL